MALLKSSSDPRWLRTAAPMAPISWASMDFSSARAADSIAASRSLSRRGVMPSRMSASTRGCAVAIFSASRREAATIRSVGTPFESPCSILSSTGRADRPSFFADSPVSRNRLIAPALCSSAHCPRNNDLHVLTRHPGVHCGGRPGIHFSLLRSRECRCFQDIANIVKMPVLRRKRP